MSNTVTQPDAISLNLAGRIADQAVNFSQSLAQLYLRPHTPDGVTELRSTLALLPAKKSTAEPKVETFDVKLGKKESIELGSLQLSNEEALALCYQLRVKIAGFRPLGAEIIHSALFPRSQVEAIMLQVLKIDWSTQAWNPQLMLAANRYCEFILSISRQSTRFSDADEDKTEKFKKLIHDELIPECHNIAAALIRGYLPTLFAAKENLLATGSPTLLEFANLWNDAQMPLFNFCLFKAFRTLPPSTRKLFATKADLSDLRDALPDIFTAYVAALKSKDTNRFDMPESSQYLPDNFLLVPEFVALVDFLKESGVLPGLDLLILFNYAEVILTVSLLKLDLIEQVLESGDKKFAEPLSQFCSALTFTCSKLSFSNSQLVSQIYQQ